MIPVEFKYGFLNCEIYLDIAVGWTNYSACCFQTECSSLHTLDCTIFSYVGKLLVACTVRKTPSVSLFCTRGTLLRFRLPLDFMVCRSALLVALDYETLPLIPAQTGPDNVCIISDLQVFNSDFIIKYNKQAFY